MRIIRILGPRPHAATLLAALLTVAATASRPSSAGVTAPNRIARERTSLLLITLDTTRADHLGCYGDARAATPALDALAAEGVFAERAYAVAPLTLPSHASILTGRYPPSHGVRDNADFRLPDSETTLAEHLRARGYSTGAVVASIVLASPLGLSQGFEVYDEPRPGPPAAGRGSDLLYRPIVDRPASEVTSSALRLLAGRGRPFFLWVHYYDPHYEYAPPQPFAQRFSDRPYDGEIAYMDSEIGRLLDGLSKLHLADSTLVLATADHGEGLGDHGEETHGLFVYDAMVRVPVIVRLPGAIPRGGKLRGLISSVDLAPTVLDLLSLPPLPRAQGSSFAREARGGRPRAREPVYSESLYPERLYGWSPLAALREAGREFVDAPEAEIYDLAADPAELANLAPAKPKEVASWRERLEALRVKLGPSPNAAERASDEEEREKLASLGYASAGGSGRARRSGGDPKKLVGQHNAFLRARWLVSKGRNDEARGLIERVLEADPGNPAALELSGTLLFTQGKADAGLAQLEAAAKASPGVYEAQRNLANAYHVAGRLADAVRTYRAGLAIQPWSGIDHFALGNALSAMHDDAGAVREYRDAIRLEYATPSVLAALGIALAATGDREGAEKSLTAAVAADSGLGEAWCHLGLLAEAGGRKADARTRLERCLALPGADPGVREKASAALERLDSSRP